MMGYWMFSGEGISSRLAEQFLLRIGGDEQHQSELGLPLHPDHVHSDYYRKYIPLSSVKDAKMRFGCGMQGLHQVEVTSEAFLGFHRRCISLSNRNDRHLELS